MYLSKADRSDIDKRSRLYAEALAHAPDGPAEPEGPASPDDPVAPDDPAKPEGPATLEGPESPAETSKFPP